MNEPSDMLHTRIWEEIPEPDNPFAAAKCFCAGYDVYGEMLGRASWAEYLYLLFRGERPTSVQARVLEDLAIVLANPGPRDPSVTAAMSGGAGGSTYASCLMAALAAGAGQLGGAHEVARAMEAWKKCGQDLAAWREFLSRPAAERRADIWLPMEHPPGFDPHGASCAQPVQQALFHLAAAGPGGDIAWLRDNRGELEDAADCPLGMPGVAAAAFRQLGFSLQQAEMLCLLLRLPGAAAHALEQEALGWRRFPFYGKALHLLDDPGPMLAPAKEQP